MIYYNYLDLLKNVPAFNKGVQFCNTVRDTCHCQQNLIFFFNIFHLVSGIETVNPRNEVEIYLHPCTCHSNCHSFPVYNHFHWKLIMPVFSLLVINR